MSIVDKILIEAKLTEILDGYGPSYDFSMKPVGTEDVHVQKFHDERYNMVEVVFAKAQDADGVEIFFRVNNQIMSQENGRKMSAANYLKILNTVTKIVKNYLDTQKPKQVWLQGTPERMRVYNKIISNINATDYQVLRYNGLTELIRKDGLQEAMIPVEHLFSGHNVNRYAFIWRDTTKYNTIEKKRAIVQRMEKLRTKSGKGLPVETLNPMLFIATQASVDSDNMKDVAHNMQKIKALPMVVKLHGVYYILDGHHRTSVALVLEKDYVQCHLLDLDKED